MSCRAVQCLYTRCIHLCFAPLTSSGRLPGPALARCTLCGAGAARLQRARGGVTGFLGVSQSAVQDEQGRGPPDMDLSNISYRMIVLNSRQHIAAERLAQLAKCACVSRTLHLQTTILQVRKDRGDSPLMAFMALQT